MRVGRRYRFSASHRLHSPLLSEEVNQELYGKCNNPYGHGHDYVLEVVVRGNPDESSGLVVNVSDLDNLVRRLVLAGYDHKYMNAEIEAFAQRVPTTENVTRDIWGRLQRGWSDLGGKAQLDGIRIWETRRNLVEVRKSR